MPSHRRGLAAGQGANPQGGEELPPGEGIERGERLVEQEDARPLVPGVLAQRESEIR